MSLPIHRGFSNYNTEHVEIHKICADCLAQTKGLPLEEIAAKFGDEVTVRLADEVALARNYTHESEQGASVLDEGKGSIDGRTLNVESASE